MGKIVNTVLGPISSDSLGKTLMHEHFFFGYPGYYGNTVQQVGREELVRVGVDVANRAKSHGVQTIVDVTPNDCGRDPEVLKEISEKSGINIICATGYYYEGEGAPAYFKFKQTLGTAEGEIYELFMCEITNGVGKTGIKPGVIKIGTGKGRISEYEEMFFKVAARVQKETGVPIVTHTQEGTMGPEQAQLLISEGVNPKKILIGHMDGNTDIRYQLKTLEQGVFVGFDRLGIQVIAGTPFDHERVAVLLGLIGSGYANQLMLSHDTVNVWLGAPTAFPEELLQLVGNWHVEHVFQNIIPTLKEAGVTDRTIDMMMKGNPKDIFS